MNLPADKKPLRKYSTRWVQLRWVKQPFWVKRPKTQVFWTTKQHFGFRNFYWFQHPQPCQCSVYRFSYFFLQKNVAFGALNPGIALNPRTLNQGTIVLHSFFFHKNIQGRLQGHISRVVLIFENLSPYGYTKIIIKKHEV